MGSRSKSVSKSGQGPASAFSNTQHPPPAPRVFGILQDFTEGPGLPHHCPVGPAVASVSG